MSEKLYKVKPLEWKHIAGVERASPPLGNEYLVYEDNIGWNWKVHGSARKSCASLEAAKAASEAHWRDYLAVVLEEVPDAAIKESK